MSSRARRGCWACAALLGAALLGLTLPLRGAAPPEGDDPVAVSRSADAPSILLVTVDTLRADHLGIYGYARPTSPRIDAWFAEGQVYERAYSTEAFTAPSIASLLTGLLPQQHGVRLLYQKIDPGIVTLPDLLGGAGYETAGVVSNVVLTAEAIGLDTRFDHYDDYVDEVEPYRPIFERRAERTTLAALAWLEARRDAGRPHFLWVHYIDPHGPYHPPDDRPADFDHAEPVRIDADRIPEYSREPGVDDGLEYLDRYDEEIAYADREIGRLFDAYVRLGLAEQTLFVFTADHGESMMEHEEWFTHGYQVYEEIARVPLLLRGPGIEAARIPHPVSLADVAPTLLRAASLETAPELYGRALSDATPGRTIFSEASGSGDAPHQWRAIWRGEKKWMLKIERVRSRLGRIARLVVGWEPFLRTRTSERRYYDLAADPAEVSPRSWPSTPEPLLRLVRTDPDPAGFPRHAEFGELIEAPKVAPGLAQADRERLRALGYLH